GSERLGGLAPTTAAAGSAASEVSARRTSRVLQPRRLPHRRTARSRAGASSLGRRRGFCRSSTETLKRRSPGELYRDAQDNHSTARRSSVVIPVRLILCIVCIPVNSVATPEVSLSPLLHRR